MNPNSSFQARIVFRSTSGVGRGRKRHKILPRAVSDAVIGGISLHVAPNRLLGPALPSAACPLVFRLDFTSSDPGIAGMIPASGLGRFAVAVATCSLA